MELKEILDKIKEKWADSERYELISELNKVPEGSSTGGEALAKTGKYLFDLNSKKPDAFLEVEDLIELFLKKCEEYKIIIRRT